jgi:hypothetical protein
MYLYWNDVRLVNFLAAWIPFVLSLLVAFVPEHEMSMKKKILWRTSVIAVGFAWSVVLWHQQVISDIAAREDQKKIVTNAVTQSNEHSDQQIGALRQDLQGVKTDVQDVKKDLDDTIAKSTSTISESIGKVTLPQSEKSSYDVSFWPATITEWPIRKKSLPIIGGVVTFTFSFIVKNHTAKEARVWLRLCEGCKYAKEPPKFQNLISQVGKGTDPTERMRVIGDFLPNVAYEAISVDVIPKPNVTSFLVGILLGCENCDPIDSGHPQVLTVNIEP